MLSAPFIPSIFRLISKNIAWGSKSTSPGKIRMSHENLFRKILIYEYLGFGIVTLVLWLNELLDIPHYIFGSPTTPINTTENIIETFIIWALAVVVIRGTSRQMEIIENITIYDPLTDLLNRRYLLEKFQHEIHRAMRLKTPLSIILGDIDDFKSINDQYGHECGDKTLHHICKILRENLRAQDVIGRWGGDEILIILPDTPLEHAQYLANKLRQIVEIEAISHNHQKIKSSMSFGVANHTLKDSTPNNCIRQADSNLYRAKKSGKNTVI
jgi:diguanylate cyclase (GGDEF)-like protein